MATFSSSRDTGPLSSNATTAAYQLAGLGRAGYLANTFGQFTGLSTTVPTGLVGSADDQRAGLQIAIWKAEYETTKTDFTDLSHGSITFGAVSSYAAQDAVVYLKAALDSNGNFKSEAANLISYQGTTNPGQDQIAIGGVIGPFVTAVPEPASIAMWGTAFLVVSGLTYRNKRKAVVAG